MAKPIEQSNHIVKDPLYQNGSLEWYGHKLSDIADKLGTPMHLGCTEAASDSYRSFLHPFKRYGLSVQVCYSVKTHPLPAYLKTIYRQGSQFETVSGWEYRLLRKMGVGNRNIIHTGDPSETSKQIQLAVIATRGQLDQAISWAMADKVDNISVGITINPHLRRGLWDITLNTGTRRSPLGFHPSSKDFNEVIRKIKDTPGMTLKGLHMHLGSAIHSPKPFMQGIDTLASAALSLKKQGVAITMLDIGGGFALPNAPMMKVRKMIPSLLGMSGKKNASNNVSVYLDSIARHLSETISKLNYEGIFITSVVAEPGRILSGPSQLTIFTVTDIISKNGKYFLVCDAGAMSISPMLLTEEHRVLPLIKREKPERTYSVMGKLPSALDRISGSVTMPELRCGDRIAVLDTGAYIISMNNTFNGPRPPIAWLENGTLQIARPRETEQGLYWDG